MKSDKTKRNEIQ